MTKIEIQKLLRKYTNTEQQVTAERDMSRETISLGVKYLKSYKFVWFSSWYPSNQWQSTCHRWLRRIQQKKWDMCNMHAIGQQCLTISVNFFLSFLFIGYITVEVVNYRKCHFLYLFELQMCF